MQTLTGLYYEENNHIRFLTAHASVQRFNLASDWLSTTLPGNLKHA